MEGFTIQADMHSHTIASAHAYSTVLEMVQYAKKQGLKMIAITDHCPAISDSPHLYHFSNMRVLPHSAEGVYIIPGSEVDVVDYDGTLGMSEKYLKSVSWVIASMHDIVLEPKAEKEHTSAWLGAAENPYVDCIGHSGQAKFPYDYERVIKAFAEYGKFVEINNASFTVRKGSSDNCIKIAQLCKKYKVPVVVNSDAHCCFSVGKVDKALQMLCEIDFPKELILNLDADRILEHIKKKRGIDYRE
jgi:putative hydrolase